jgi:hypothetical protein
MVTSTKKAKDHAKAALDLLLKKYDADEITIDCEKMSSEDYSVFIELDKCIEILKEMLVIESVAK